MLGFELAGDLSVCDNPGEFIACDRVATNSTEWSLCSTVHRNEECTSLPGYQRARAED